MKISRQITYFTIIILYASSVLFAAPDNFKSETTQNSNRLTLQLLTEQVLQVIKAYPQIGTKPWNYQIMTNDLSYQVGSLVKLVMQLEGERYRHGKTNEEIKLEIADELTDIIFNTLFIAHELNIDLNDAWPRMIKSHTQDIHQRSQLKVSND